MTIAVIRIIITLTALVVFNTACVVVRHMTYPPEFVYLESSEVTGVMHEMADSLYLLDDMVSRIGEEDHLEGKALEAALLKELDKIENAAANLGLSAASDGIRTNHLLIDENIDQFLADIASAKLQLIANPPNYFMVGQLIGGCSACHSQR